MQTYQEFLKTKLKNLETVGIDCNDSEISEKAFKFQKHLIKLALKKGRYGLFLGTGLGKSLCQLNWANILTKRLGIKALILAPLGVAKQTVDEGKKFGIEIKYVAQPGDITEDYQIFITNYERLENFDCSIFDAVVIDESSCLKSYTSSTRNLIIDSFEKTPYKLSCSATPSPNDYMELGNQAEFLGIMSRVEMLSMFFEHDGGDTSKWILKYHARNNFWEWVNSWSIMINHPRDLGEEFDQPGYDLPPLNFTTHKVDTRIIIDSKKLIQPEAKGLSEQRKVRNESLTDRCNKAAEIINNSYPSEYPWLIWCETNAESELLTKIFSDAVEVKGSDKETKKEKVAKDFANKKIDVLITKPSIFGYGMNWQQCCNVIYIGLTHSAEDFYQSVRRLYRFGQENTVNVHIIQHPLEGQIERNLKRKEAEALVMLQGMVNASKTYQNASKNKKHEQVEIIIPTWLKTEC